jgi:hypothetical protein
MEMLCRADQRSARVGRRREVDASGSLRKGQCCGGGIVNKPRFVSADVQPKVCDVSLKAIGLGALSLAIAV